MPYIRLYAFCATLEDIFRVQLRLVPPEAKKPLQSLPDALRINEHKELQFCLITALAVLF
jgi:hypothetical protein